MRSLFALFLAVPVCLSGGNLFTEDTGFETGPQNFRYYRSENPIRTVTDDAAEGKSSLEIDSAVSWAQGLWGYTVKRDTDYTVSFHARRVSGSGEIEFAMIDISNWEQNGKARFQLSGEWKRYSCHIRTDRAGTALFPAFMPRGETVFRIDAIQLEEGSAATPYRPAELFSIYPTVNAPGEVVYTPEIPKLTVTLFNAEAEGNAFTLRVTLPGLERKAPFQLKRGETGTVAVEFPEAAAPGYYPALVEILDRTGRTLKKSAAPFVVTRPFAKELRPGFFGMQDSPLPNSFLRRIGTSHVRTILNPWKAMEVREGEFREFPLTPPAGVFWHPTFNREFTPGYIPAWGFRPGSVKADLGKAAIYLEHFFRQLRGKAELIDFINEPDLQFRNMPDGAEYYCELLKTAAPVARKYGIKLLVDASGNGGNFYGEVYAKAHDFFDISAPHPYCSPRIFGTDGRYVASPEKGNFVSTLRYQHELARQYGKEFLIGELGYSLEETIPFGAPAAHRMAAYLARMFLIARSYPECRYLIWFLGLDRWEAGPYRYGIWRTENGIRPLPAVAAYAQAAHEIDFAEDAKMILDSDIKILRWRKDNRVSYAVWNAGDDAEPLALDTLPNNAELRSIYGTPLKKAAVSGVPLYLSENENGTVLPALLATIESRPPLIVRGYLRDGGTLRLHLRNRSFRDWKGEVSIDPFFRSGTLTVPRQSSETLTVRRPVRGTFRLTMRGENGGMFGQNITLPPMLEVRRLKVDNLATFDFPARPGEIIQKERGDVFPPDPGIPWSGPEDLSHRTLLGWDEKNFYIFSEVRDDVHTNTHPDRDSWRGDSLQLGIDSFNNADDGLAYDSDDHEFTFAQGKSTWSHHAPPFREPGARNDIRQIITRSEETHTTTYRIAIPQEAIAPLKLREGTVFGFALCVNDEDPGEKRYCMAFGDGIADRKCPGLFRKAILISE